MKVVEYESKFAIQDSQVNGETFLLTIFEPNKFLFRKMPGDIQPEYRTLTFLSREEAEKFIMKNKKVKV